MQHPLGSALVSRAFEGAQSRAALGTYNFSGDVGKVLLPALCAAVVLAVLPLTLALRPALRAPQAG